MSITNGKFEKKLLTQQLVRHHKMVIMVHKLAANKHKMVVNVHKIAKNIDRTEPTDRADTDYR